MKILFLTLVNIESINERNIYTDLLRKFRNEGHDVYVVTPSERRLKKPTTITNNDGVTLLKIKTLNIQKTNILEKGISTLLIEHLFLSGIKKYISGIKIDLILYSTPPITFTKVIKYIKNRDKAISYLLLKDIFPQNAVDLGMIKKNDIIYRYFRHKEKVLYQISDFIGCMSLANTNYVIKHNPDIDPRIVEVNPNSIEPCFESISEEDQVYIRKRYNIPHDKTVFIYGGNLGKPQGIDFLLDVLNHNKDEQDVFFVIVGNGTEFTKVQSWFIVNNPRNAQLIDHLSKKEFDQLIQSCDVGMIFLDRRFTIPNFPSRLLSYLEYKLPIIAATDPNTDLGKIIEENKFGYWVESGDLSKFNKRIVDLTEVDGSRKIMGENGHKYLLENCTVSYTYSKIMSCIQRRELV